MASSQRFSLSLSSMLFLFTLIVVYATLFVSPSLQNQLHSSTSMQGFTSKLKNVDSDKNLTTIELLQLAIKRGRERMKSFEAKMVGVESMRHGVTFASHVQQLSGEFLINLSIGTPKPLSFTAVIDTGSDLIWTLCKPYIKKSFDPKKSSSYSKLNCTSDLCKSLDSINRNCKKCEDCKYIYKYGDGSYIQGVLATDTFTFERNVFVPKLGFGCTFDIHGDFGSYQGIVGLGRTNLSLVSQMKVAKFLYCLPRYNETGVFSMGSVATTPRGAKTTPLIINPFFPTQYYLSLQGITIGNTRLHININKFEIKKNGKGGMLIDSGTTLTYLEKSAFNQVTKELTHQLNLPTFDGSTNHDIDLELCYNITRPINKIRFPNFTFHFQGQGADFEVIPDYNFFFVDDKKTKQRTGVCLNMGSSSYNGLSIFGSFQQQNALVVYDVAQNKLSFLTNTKCNTYLAN